MNEFPPVIFTDAVPEGRAFLMPTVDVTVFYPAKQPAPTIEQEVSAIVNAYLAAARQGRIGVIDCRHD